MTLFTIDPSNRPTVLTMAGTFGDPSTVPPMLRGDITRGNTVVPVLYNNWGLWDENIVDGMNKLDAKLHAVEGPKVVLGHSMGALAATRWLCDKGPTSDINPADVTFILMGNSGRRYGGIYNGQSDIGELLRTSLGQKTRLTPKDTPYRVIDICRQYDGYADVPDGNNLTNWPVLNTVMSGANTVHPYYNDIDINAADNCVFVEGNVSYVVAPTYPLPTLQSIKWWADFVKQQDREQRPKIEAAFSRPMSVPMPTYGPVSVRNFTTDSSSLPVSSPEHSSDAVVQGLTPTEPGVPVSGSVNGSVPLTDALSVIDRQATEIRKEHESIRRAKPLIRIWMNNPDGSPGLKYVGRVDYDDTIRGSFPFKNNTPSQGILELRDDHYIAIFLKKLPNDKTLKKNIVITVDFFGGRKRWSGLMDKWTIKYRNNVRYFEVAFMDDLTYLQYLLCPPNPWLPIPVFQFPRIFALAGPAKWCISMLLHLNIMRNEGNWYTLPDDPFDVESWQSGFDMSTWQVLVKASPWLLDDSSLWSFLSARMNPADAVIADALDDAQLTLTYRRVLTVDGETCPVDGVPHCANGTLVFEVVDNSEAHALEGTAFDGTIVDGFVRSVMTYGGGFVEDSLNVVSDTDQQGLQPDEYYQSGWLGTIAKKPWLVVRDNEWTQIESSDLSWGPAKNVSVVVGGDNPAADAIAKLIIETTGNLIGYFLLGGFSSAGSIAAEVIMPFLVGTIAAWLHWKNTGRATALGWAHYWETYQQGAENNAWSLSALNALRGGFLSGRSETVHLMALHDSWIIPGVHIDIGQRMGSTVNAKGVEEIIWVNQLEEMTGAWDNSDKLTALTWVFKAGKSDRAMSVGERMARLSKKMSEALNNIGVHIVQS